MFTRITRINKVKLEMSSSVLDGDSNNNTKKESNGHEWNGQTPTIDYNSE